MTSISKIHVLSSSSQHTNIRITSSIVRPYSEIVSRDRTRTFTVFRKNETVQLQITFLPLLYTSPDTNTIGQSSIQLLKGMSNFVPDTVGNATIKLEWNVTIGPSVILARKGLSGFLFCSKIGFELVFSQTQIVNNVHSIFVNQKLGC